MKTQIEQITPDLARAYLKTNLGNRAVRAGKVDDYALAMLGGEWQLTHQGIAFDDKGVLLDGQHRLLAVIESGMTIPMMVTKGAPRSTFEALDQGAKRTFSDILSISPKQAEIASYLAWLLNKRGKVTPQMVKAIVTKAGDDLIEFERRILTRNTRYLSNAPTRSAVFCHFLNPASRDYVTENYNLILQASIEDCSPAVKSLFKQLMLRTNTKSGTRNIEGFCRAFMAFDPKRREVTRVQLSDVDSVLTDAVTRLRTAHSL